MSAAGLAPNDAAAKALQEGTLSSMSSTPFPFASAPKQSRYGAEMMM
mgnify:CR=1 FL=1